MVVSKYGSIRIIETKIRSSMAYAKWVTRNKAPSCLGCGKQDGLECHHVVNLYQIVMGFWKLYEDESSVLSHVLAMHDNDECENVTLCNDCHARRHPLRVRPIRKNGPMSSSNWTAYPRRFRPPLAHSTCGRTSSSLGLVGFQVALSLGWYVLNGHMDSRIVEVNRRDLARMLDKAPGTSFNTSLDDALRTLSKLEILDAHHRAGNDLELHLSSNYLDELGSNPWFMPLSDVAASSMCVVALRWFLGTQSNKRKYKISLEKLVVHLGITVKDNWMAAKAVKKACDNIDWAEVEIVKGDCMFSIIRRGATPIHDLRSILLDSLKQGR